MVFSIFESTNFTLMKAIIIFLLVIIIAILGYNFYNTWQRFNPPNYHYVSENEVPNDHLDKELLLNYHEAVEKLNGYVITQWSANDIDVRNPADDDEVTVLAVAEYAEKLGSVRYYENQLVKTVAKEPSKDAKKKALIKKMFYVNPSQNEFKLGQRSAFIFEVQGILNEKGAAIKHDGHYRNETLEAIKKFEEKNNFFPDGKMDALTLEALLQ